ncbi:TenA family protein [Actinomycetospora atypica]|uniref:Aminopyrimidine aminohydrolase n=1 Tax=Actinomycetospora atypica TaxID=1290095 RepID=A0ABV9YT63_9PSEU
MISSNDLRAAHTATWDAAVGHRFVDELWAGTVDDAVMARYLAQDALFLDAFVALLGAAVATVDAPGPRLVHARQLGLVAGDEDDYFARALARLGVPEPAEPLAATTGFLALMDAARASGDYPTIVTVLLVAEWLYLDWASRDADAPSDWLHAEWIELHRGPAFSAWVGFLRDEADRVGPDGAAFARAVELEAAFFDAAYG